MGALAHSAKTIQRRNAQAGGEVSVGTPAYRCFLKFPVQLPGDFGSLFVKRSHARSPLHRRTIDASRDLQLAFAIERLAPAKFAVDRGRIFHAPHPYVERGG